MILQSRVVGSVWEQGVLVGGFAEAECQVTRPIESTRSDQSYLSGEEKIGFWVRFLGVLVHHHRCTVDVILCIISTSCYKKKTLVKADTGR